MGEVYALDEIRAAVRRVLRARHEGPNRRAGWMSIAKEASRSCS